MAVNVAETLKRIQADPDLTRKFMKDPQGTLTEMGVNVENLKVSRATDPRATRVGVRPAARISSELRMGRLDALDRMGGRDLKTAVTICGSIGYIVCGSVGD
jgi:hypothetical protein